MHKSRLAQIIIDCQTAELDAAAVFWSQALGWPSQPVTDPDDANYRQFDSPRDQMGVQLQAVEHPSRVHIDIETNDVEAEVRRLEALGARRVQQIRTWWVMEAPTGHRFCVVRPQRDDLEENGNVWP